MKTKWIAAGILLAVCIFAVGNAAALRREIEKIENAVSASGAECDVLRIKKAEEEFCRREAFFSLTIHHATLRQIEQDLAELSGAAEAGDEQTFIAVKQKVLSALARLKRLSGWNFESIL